MKEGRGTRALTYMEGFNAFCQSNLPLIYGVYGLAFVVTGESRANAERVAAGVEEFCHFGAAALIGFGGGIGEVMQAAMHVGVFAVIGIRHALEHRAIRAIIAGVSPTVLPWRPLWNVFVHWKKAWSPRVGLVYHLRSGTVLRLYGGKSYGAVKTSGGSTHFQGLILNSTYSNSSLAPYTYFNIDDGLPACGTLTVLWEQVSGPGAVSFADPAAADTAAHFTLPGDYVLRLTVALVMEMNRVCRQRGITFLVASFPNGIDFAAEPPLHGRFHELLSRAAVRVVDFRARFSALGMKPADVTLDDTGHLSPRGHALVAEVLEREIITERSHQADRRTSAGFGPPPPA